MRILDFKLVLASLVLIGGFDGSGGRLSPYSASDKVTVKLVKQFREASARKRTAFLEPLSTGAPVSVLLAWTKAGENSQPIQTLTGTDASGKKLQIDMAVLSQLKIVSVDSDRRTLLADVEIFPDISPDELVKMQPTYRQLWSGYRRTIQLRIDASNSKGRTLGLMDARTPGNPNLAIVSLAQGTVIVVLPHKKMMVERPNLWWAIPSVMDDLEYPYRFETRA